MDEEQQKVWDRLKYIPPEIDFIEFDVNPMYAQLNTVIGISKTREPLNGELKIRVLKNR